MSKISDDLDSLKIQFYAVSSVLGFLVIVLLSLVIDLSVRVRKLKKTVEDEDEEIETTQKSPPPPLNPAFSLPKPNYSKNWHDDDDADIRRQNEQKEYSVPKPALSKSWNAYPGDRDRHQPKRNYGHDDNMSTNSYEDQKSPQFKLPGNAYRNPLSAHDSDKYDNRSDRQSRPPGQKSGASFNQGGNDNYGYKRDFRHNNNNYY